MNVKILGYWGGHPTAGGATAGYLVTTDEGRILLDCGSGVMSRLLYETKVEALSGVIVSHLHHDHIADLGILQYAAAGAIRNERMGHKLTLYAPGEPSEILNNLYGAHTDVHIIDACTRVALAGADIEFVPVRHTIPCYAVKITYKGKTLVYSGDTAYCDSLIELARNADIFLCEATICQGSVHTTGLGHMDAIEAGKIAGEARVKKLVLVHLPGDGDLEMMRRSAGLFYKGPVDLPEPSRMYIV